MMANSVNQKVFNQLTAKGLTQRVVSTLRVMQGTDSINYWTISDIAYEVIKRLHPTLEVNQPTFVNFANAINNTIAQCVKARGHGVHRSISKIASRSACLKYDGLKTGFGFRIGAPITPMINRDIYVEQQLSTAEADRIIKDPLSAILPLLDLCTSSAQLTAVIVEALAKKDKMYLEIQTELFNNAMTHSSKLSIGR